MIETPGRNCLNQKSGQPPGRGWLKLLLCVCGTMFATGVMTAAPILDTGNPLCFFTNVASRLLATELNVNLTRIQIYPMNQYTPAVQRLLQVAANLYDATTNQTAALGHDFPTVFRPLFSGDVSGNVFITGYTNVPSVSGAGDVVFSQPFDASAIAGVVGVNVPLNVYGVPWIIGAKKGFPNFNEISMDNVVTIIRELQVTRQSLTQYAPIVATNAQYIFSISNSIGIEFWNSYTNAYTNNFEVVVYDNISMNLTNDLGFSYMKSQFLSQDFVCNFWPRSSWFNGALNPNAPSPFYIPINASVPFVTNQVYQNSGGGGWVIPGNSVWQTELTLPHLGLLTTNRLQAFILVTDKNNIQHVIDYVHFNGPDSQRDLNAEIQTIGTAAGYDNMWNANATRRDISFGIASQFGVSEGQPAFQQAYWGGTQEDLNRAIAAIDGFTYFMGGTPTMPVPLGYESIYESYVTNYTVQVPYTPTVTAYYYSSWQANDPLVHTFPGDMIFSDPAGPPRTGTNVYYGSLAYLTKNVTPASGTATNGLLPNIGVLNQRYQPWGKVYQYQYFGAINSPYNSTLKDPLVRQSDDWNFPAGQSLNPIWIGQVHRGTPWQTIYLKATNILALTSGLNTWKIWTGNTNSVDATNTAPVKDWHVASLLTALFSTNNLATLFRVNNPDPVAWQELFDGLTAYTNIPEALNSVTISSNSLQASVIANAIQSARAVQPGQTFNDVGDVLATPQLAEQSPFLAGLNATNQISDEAYEIIPSQLLSLLRSDSTGSIVLMNSQPLIQFTGYDNHAYAVQASSDFVNWSTVSTNYPVNGIFNITNSMMSNASPQFYRSVLLQ
jgi:hypothetical protein